MSFSNAHLQVPRGFASVLEGLVREILRDQPEDIPKYAAAYFDALLEQRQESGVDPAEWAAKLEDRFYNNQPVKTAEAEPGQDNVAEETAAQEKAPESQTEGETSDSAEGLNLSSALSLEKAHSSESTDEEDDAEENTVEKGNAEGESVNRLPTLDIQSDEPSGTDEERDPTITAVDQVDGTVNETDSSSVPVQNTPHSEPELLSSEGIASMDVCAQESEEEGGDEQATENKETEFGISDRAGNNNRSEPSETFSHSGFADVDICASELGGAERKIEGSSTEVDIPEEVESVKPQLEVTVGEASLSEMPESDHQEVEDGAENTGEEQKTETEDPSGQTHESLAHLESDFDCNVTPKEDSLVEISFEDVPEAQQIAEVVQTELSETQQEETEEVTVTTIEQKMSDAQEYRDLELEGVKKEVDSEKEAVEERHNSFDRMEKHALINDSNDDDEKRMKSESTSSLDKSNTEAEKESEDDKTARETEDNESEFPQDEDSDTGVLVADKDEMHKEGYMEMEDQEINDGGAGNNSSQASLPSTSEAPLETERKMFEESAEDPAEEGEGGPPGVSQPGDLEEEKEATSKEAEEVTENKEEEKEDEYENDSEVEESSVAVLPQKVNVWTSADHQAECEENPPEMESSNKEECSRPQEEEDIMDIPLDDPEANRAAAKIQAGFRGHMTRKKMKPEDKAEGEERQEDRGQ